MTPVVSLAAWPVGPEAGQVRVRNTCQRVCAGRAAATAAAAAAAVAGNLPAPPPLERELSTGHMHAVHLLHMADPEDGWLQREWGEIQAASGHADAAALHLEVGGWFPGQVTAGVDGSWHAGAARVFPCWGEKLQEPRCHRTSALGGAGMRQAHGSLFHNA